MALTFFLDLTLSLSFSFFISYFAISIQNKVFFYLFDLKFCPFFWLFISAFYPLFCLFMFLFCLLIATRQKFWSLEVNGIKTHLQKPLDDVTDTSPNQNLCFICAKQKTYRRKGNMPTSGDLFGSLVSDLVPRSTKVKRFQKWTEFRVWIQQQLCALVYVRKKNSEFKKLPVNITWANLTCTRIRKLTSEKTVGHWADVVFGPFQFHTKGFRRTERWCCCRWLLWEDSCPRSRSFHGNSTSGVRRCSGRRCLC